MRQSEIAHVADEIRLARFAAQAGIEAALFRDARHREPAIIVRRIEQACRRQRENLTSHRSIEHSWIAVLEVRSSASANQQAIAGECRAFVVENEREAAL